MDENILRNLCSKAKLDRDKGFDQIQKYLQTADNDAVAFLEKKFADMFADTSNDWETKHGVLMGSKALCNSSFISEEFCAFLLSKAVDLADDSEFRVRIAAGLTLILVI